MTFFVFANTDIDFNKLYTYPRQLLVSLNFAHHINN